MKKVRLACKDLASDEELKKIYLAKLDFAAEAVAITVDGKAVAWVQDEAEAKQAIEKFKAGFSREDCEMLSLELENDLAYKEDKVNTSKLIDCEALINLLKTGTDKIEIHTVAEGDTLWSIARANNTKIADILKANPDMTEDAVLALGKQIKLTKTEPLVHAQAVYKKSVTGVIAFDTEYVKDSNLASGQMEVKQAGQDGEKEVIYRFRTRDGVKVGQETLGATVVKEPIKQIVAAGSSVTLASRGGSGSGSMRWPLVGNITCPFGGGHTGLDIDGETGDPIVAAASGTVSFAGYSGGYGNCIIITHNNGLKTRYAHCSSLAVSAGAEVSSGEVIARVGSTGHSTGSHLHFEVIANGSCMNPRNYLR